MNLKGKAGRDAHALFDPTAGGKSAPARSVGSSVSSGARRRRLGHWRGHRRGRLGRRTQGWRWRHGCAYLSKRYSAWLQLRQRPITFFVDSNSHAYALSGRVPAPQPAAVPAATRVLGHGRPLTAFFPYPAKALPEAWSGMRGMAFTPTRGMGFTAGMTLVRVEGATGSRTARRSAWITSRATRTGSSRAMSARSKDSAACV